MIGEKAIMQEGWSLALGVESGFRGAGMAVMPGFSLFIFFKLLTMCQQPQGHPGLLTPAQGTVGAQSY